MELFREIVPALKRVLVAYDATNPDALAQLRVHRDAARRLGLALVERPVRSEADARVAITGLKRDNADGMFAVRDLSWNTSGFILDAAQRGVMPTMFDNAFFVERGGLASYAANTYELGKQAARLVARILKGAKPADLPVEQPVKFELAINAKAAKALGLVVPPAVLLRADRV